MSLHGASPDLCVAFKHRVDKGDYRGSWRWRKMLFFFFFLSSFLFFFFFVVGPQSVYGAMERRPVGNTGIVRGHKVSKSASQEERQDTHFFFLFLHKSATRWEYAFLGIFVPEWVPMITSALHGEDFGSVLFHETQYKLKEVKGCSARYSRGIAGKSDANLPVEFALAFWRCSDASTLIQTGWIPVLGYSVQTAKVPNSGI